MIDQAKLDLLNPLAPQKTVWNIESITGEISELSLSGGEIKQLTLKSLLFRYSAGSLHISRGKSIFDGQVIEVEGRIAQLASNRPIIDLNVVGTLAADWFGQFWPEERYTPIALKGTIPLTGQIKGPLKELKIDFQADLDSLQFIYPSYLTLSAQPDDRMTLSSKFKDNVLIVEHVEVKFASMTFRSNGRIPLDKTADSTLTALLSIPDLGVLPKVSPKLAKLNLDGQAELSITQQGRVPNSEPEAYLILRNAKISTGQTIVDINGINGRFHISKHGVSSQHLQAHLGSSLVNASLRLQDYDDPVIKIDFSIPRIRADELIFFSDSLYLRDVNGHLMIDKNAIRFSPVKLSLDGGSTPEVNGSVIFGNPAIVDLTVSSTYANIEEIIQLWTKETEQSKSERLDRKPQKPADWHAPKITIKAMIKEGSLFGMRFRDATANITPTTRQLIIHPLDFYVGDGYCNSQVIVDYPAENNTTLLRISGHAEDVDAFQVYDELLKQKNIIRGLLRGDFYLQGVPGPTYLSSSYGHFNLEINNGVLRKFHILSKVFSLLNISQLLALQLPDMDREGLPFQNLSANLHLENGRLTTEDLVIRSESMNQSYQGSFSLIDKELDLLLAIQPLITIDKIVSHLPVAGWVLGGEDKALITVHFRIEGPAGSATVTPAPITSLSEKTIGLVRRTLSLPFKLVTDPKVIWGVEDQGEKKPGN
ncbi:MAG: AsmA-like C-terminal domain-containing protein [Deltaproteobacteria bacterium]|nr:AsmA-like C-terminal domain-containing protein [Deltaproteobacteria bacterium]